MKKIVPIILSLLLILVVAPVSSFADEQRNLLTGVPSDEGKTEATDGDKNTYTQININTVINWTFETTADLTSYYHHADGSTNIVVFYDSSNKAIFRKTLPATSDAIYYFDEPVLKGVKRIQIYGSYLTKVNLREFYVTGYMKEPVKHEEISNLSISSLKNGVQLNFNQPLDNPNFINSKLYKNGNLLTTIGKGVKSFIDYDVESFKDYTYKLTAVYDDDFETSGIVQTFMTDQISTDPIDDVPPAEISNLKADIAEDYINFTFDIPPDEDFDHVNVYKNGVVVGQTYNGIYHMEKLEPDTEYSFKFTTVDMFGNESNGVVKSFTTLSDIDTTPPEAPTGVKIDPRSNGLIVTYKRNTERDLAGYNIYVDGSKHNPTPVTSTSYTVPGLDTDSSYSIYVTAVDKSGNESAPSETIIGTTSSESLPLFEMGFSLADVVVAVSNWFDTMWLIVAFAVAIPLSFYIAARTKILFLD